MKKCLSLLLVSIMMVCGFAVAEAPVIEPIVGRITEVREDQSYIVTALDDSGNQFHVLTNEETAFGADWIVGMDDVIIVQYDGRTTRSMPPQLTAQSIHSFTLEGEADEIDAQGNRILVETKDVGDVWVTLPANVSAASYDDKDVRVYFSGAVSMSYPAQATGYAVDIVHTEDGRVSEMGDGFFMIKDDGEETRINYDDHTKMTKPVNVGDEVIVYHRGMTALSMPPQMYALVVTLDLDD